MKIERLIAILSVLLQQEKVTAPFLAEKFEVSRRTILRDLDHLCKAGIPLVTFQGKNGGISIMPEYRIERTLFTSSDMQGLLAGLRSLDSVCGTARYQQLMTKLCGGNASILAANHFAIDLSSWYQTALVPKIQLIEDAIEQKKRVVFSYYAPKGQSQRYVEPYLIVFQWSSWYLWGFCMERQGYRLFKLNRMLSVEKSEESFSPQEFPAFEIKQKLFFKPEIFARILFTPQMEWRLIEEYGPDSFTKQADGRLLFEFAFQDEQNLLAWILSFENQAELLEPAVLRKKLCTIGKALAEKYSKS